MEPSAIDRAKKSISSAEPLSAWIGPRPQFTPPPTESKSFTIGEQTFVDRCPRLPLENYLDDTHGDSLPQHPAVLLNVCSDWDCFSSPWTISTLSSIVPSTPLSLDGGPGFARGSICFGSVTLPEYARYCKGERPQCNCMHTKITHSRTRSQRMPQKTQHLSMCSTTESSQRSPPPSQSPLAFRTTYWPEILVALSLPLGCWLVRRAAALRFTIIPPR